MVDIGVSDANISSQPAHQLTEIFLGPTVETLSYRMVYLIVFQVKIKDELGDGEKRF